MRAEFCSTHPSCRRGHLQSLPKVQFLGRFTATLPTFRQARDPASHCEARLVAGWCATLTVRRAATVLSATYTCRAGTPKAERRREAEQLRQLSPAEIDKLRMSCKVCSLLVL